MTRRNLVLCLTLALACCLHAPSTPARENPEALLKAAEAGDAAAQTKLGMAYRYGGQGLPLDDELAAELFRRAAENGHDVARCELGAMRWNGNGMRKDEREAEQWCGPAAVALQKAAEKGDALARRNVGRMCQLGMGLPKDIKQAAEWYRKAAEQGDAEAQYALGRMYDRGGELPQDFVQAAAWYMKAAELGHAEAQYVLGRMYRKDRGVTEDNGQAETWIRKAAEQGHADAQIFLGWMYDQASGVSWVVDSAREWYDKGIEGLTRAAKRGDPNAMFSLRQEYKHGRSVREDAAQAAVWQLKAEEQLGADEVEKRLNEAEEDGEWKFFLF